jgi:hypothetical protein
VQLTRNAHYDGMLAVQPSERLAPDALVARRPVWDALASLFLDTDPSL